MIRFLKKLLSLVFFLGVVAAIGYFVVVPRFVPLEYEEYVEKYASQYQVEPSLVYAVIFCESGYDPQAVSHSGSKGLMQISDDTAVWAAQQIEGMDAENLNVMDPDENIQIGCWYLHWLHDKFNGNTQTCLAAYNAGHNKVAQWLADEEKKCRWSDAGGNPLCGNRSVCQKSDADAESVPVALRCIRRKMA